MQQLNMQAGVRSFIPFLSFSAPGQLVSLFATLVRPFFICHVIIFLPSPILLWIHFSMMLVCAHSRVPVLSLAFTPPKWAPFPLVRITYRHGKSTLRDMRGYELAPQLTANSPLPAFVFSDLFQHLSFFSTFPPFSQLAQRSSLNNHAPRGPRSRSRSATVRCPCLTDSWYDTGAWALSVINQFMNVLATFEYQF